MNIRELEDMTSSSVMDLPLKVHPPTKKFLAYRDVLPVNDTAPTASGI